MGGSRTNISTSGSGFNVKVEGFSGGGGCVRQSGKGYGGGFSVVVVSQEIKGKYEEMEATMAAVAVVSQILFWHYTL